MTARVLVTEGHPVTRWGICRLIDEQDDLEVVGDAATTADAVRMTRALVPDVVIIGLAHPDQHGLPLARQLRDRFDDLGIVVLGVDDDSVLLGAFETGVSAFVSRSAPVTEVVAAVRHAAVAAASFTAAGLAAALRRQRDAVAPASELSDRERQVLQLLVAGQSVPSLAGSLHISSSTAKTYVARIYEKLGVRNRAEAVLAAVYLGLAGPAGPATGARPAHRAELVADPGAA